MPTPLLGGLGGFSQCGQSELGQLSALTWPDQPAGCAGAVIVDVPVDHALGGAEEVQKLTREEVAQRWRGGVHLSSLLSLRVARCAGQHRISSLSILARRRGAVCAASAQLQWRLPGDRTFQLAAMAKIAS
jgi:hypothetical protein